MYLLELIGFFLFEKNVVQVGGLKSNKKRHSSDKLSMSRSGNWINYLISTGIELRRVCEREQSNE